MTRDRPPLSLAVDRDSVVSHFIVHRKHRCCCFLLLHHSLSFVSRTLHVFCFRFHDEEWLLRVVVEEPTRGNGKQRWYDTYVPSFSLPKLFVVVSICVLSPVPSPHSTERIMIKSPHSFFMLLTATLHHCTHHRKARTVFLVMRLHQLLSSSLTTVCGFHVYAPQMSTTRTSCAIPRKHYNTRNTEPSRGRRMVPHSRTITTALYYARS